ncbi:hypothetical protein GCM10007862_08060 [Dyella lipolytica]|uniref:hypothetical protein n=1 Tax=Dyella lipolytica TaxID=1867835 RepID=UPI00235D17F4|nr:hypothetical protein GCM10007862_08060 [Dyella lipolytica]
MSPIALITLKPTSCLCPLETFIACAHQMLDPVTPEPVLCAMEPKLLAQLPALRALGVFELFEVRDPSLRAWLDDELAKLVAPASVFGIDEIGDSTATAQPVLLHAHDDAVAESGS